MHNSFLVYFVNLCLFRAYLGPSSWGTTVCIQQLVPIILFRRLSVVLVVGLELMYAVVFSWSWPRVEPVCKVWLSIHRCIHSLIRVDVTDPEGLFRHICHFDFVYESCFSNFLGTFAKLRKASISFVMFVCLSTPTGLVFTKFDIYFRKSVEYVQVSLKSDKNNGRATWRPINVFDHISLSSS
jgi:hypothetical protein